MRQTGRYRGFTACGVARDYRQQNTPRKDVILGCLRAKACGVARDYRRWDVRGRHEPELPRAHDLCHSLALWPVRHLEETWA